MTDRLVPEAVHGRRRTRNATWLSVLIPLNSWLQIPAGKWAFWFKNNILRVNDPNRSAFPIVQPFSPPREQALPDDERSYSTKLLRPKSDKDDHRDNSRCDSSRKTDATYSGINLSNTGIHYYERQCRRHLPE